MTDSSQDDQGKIFPRNLTARAAYQVPGNPAASRLEKTVANSYPGLEMHSRSLDNRFFPGLVFAFIDLRDNPPSTQDPARNGAKLLYVDNSDPAIYPPRNDDSVASKLYDDLTSGLSPATALGEGIWYLDQVEQAGKTIRMVESDGKTPLAGLYVWRLVRSLAPSGPVTITLRRRDVDNAEPVELTGWRRRYTDPETGVLDLAFKPGELGSSLCSPWTHDFRDCACHYWASNHPDIVHGVISEDEERLPDGRAANAVEAFTPLDWLRSDRSPAGRASVEDTIEKNRPYQLDHYEINHRWQELNFVLQNYEIGETYTPFERPDEATPYASAEEMVTALQEDLAPLEMVLLLEYLYARYTVKTPEECDLKSWPELADDVTAFRHSVMMVAAGEMNHLRWANQLLWGLYNAPGLGLDPADYKPILTPHKTIPSDTGWRPRALRQMDPQAIEDFLEIEEPSGYIEGAYARVVATLKQPQYPKHLYELAVRIDSDGVDHFSRFCWIKTRMQAYGKQDGKYPYLRDVTLNGDKTKDALDLFNNKLLPFLETTFSNFADGDFDEAGKELAQARTVMRELDTLADELAAKGFGIPFWEDDA